MLRFLEPNNEAEGIDKTLGNDMIKTQIHKNIAQFRRLGTSMQRQLDSFQSVPSVFAKATWLEVAWICKRMLRCIFWA